MKIKFQANWFMKIQEGIKKGIVCFQFQGNKNDKLKLAEFLKKLHSIQEKKNKLKDLDITIEYHYKKRTISSNNLMRALYAIIANEMNAGKKIGHDLVLPEKLYDDDLIEYAPRIEMMCPEKNTDAVKKLYRIILKEEPRQHNYVYIQAVISSSHFTTIEMGEWIDMLFQRCSSLGIDIENGDDIKKYWIEWKQKRNKESISEKMTHMEYKKKFPDCEATGKYLFDEYGHSTGHIAHIKSVGSGGKDEPDNWLHLSHEAHLLTQHQKGWGEFLKEYPHLRDKVENALFGQTIKNLEEVFQTTEV